MNEWVDGKTVSTGAEPTRGQYRGTRSRAERSVQAQGLLDLAEQLQGILLPVQPAPGFRRRLRGDLILEVQRRKAIPAPASPRQHRKGLLIGAAIGSVASVVGVIVAFVLRSRHGRATHPA